MFNSSLRSFVIRKNNPERIADLISINFNHLNNNGWILSTIDADDYPMLRYGVQYAENIDSFKDKVQKLARDRIYISEIYNLSESLDKQIGSYGRVVNGPHKKVNTDILRMGCTFEYNPVKSPLALAEKKFGLSEEGRIERLISLETKIKRQNRERDERALKRSMKSNI
jgi:hypothetical protein